MSALRKPSTSADVFTIDACFGLDKIKSRHDYNAAARFRHSPLPKCWLVQCCQYCTLPTSMLQSSTLLILAKRPLWRAPPEPVQVELGDAAMIRKAVGGVSQKGSGTP